MTAKKWMKIYSSEEKNGKERGDLRQNHDEGFCNINMSFWMQLSEKYEEDNGVEEKNRNKVIDFAKDRKKNENFFTLM